MHRSVDKNPGTVGSPSQKSKIFASPLINAGAKAGFARRLIATSEILFSKLISVHFPRLFNLYNYIDRKLFMATKFWNFS